MIPGIVFTDLDGTFLTTEKEVHPRCREALGLLEERGVPFIICTGRPLSGVGDTLLGLPGVRYVVCANGAYVVELDRPGDRASARTIMETPMGAERVAALYDAVGDLDITFDVMADGQAYSEAARMAKLPTFGLEPHFMEQIRSSRTVVDGTIPELLPSLGRIDRVSVYFHDGEQRRAVEEAAAAIPGLHWTSSESTNLEISDGDASKGAALGWLCDHLSIPREASVAFGDGMNDSSMLAAAGTGVVMANGQPGVADYADAVTPVINDEGGVGEFLMAAMEG